jgi:hypothetical protein
MFPTIVAAAGEAEVKRTQGLLAVVVALVTFAVSVTPELRTK